MNNRFSELEKLYTRAVELHRQGDPGAALPLYKTVAHTLPDADIVQYNLGLALHELEHYEEAIDAFQIALKTNPEDADTWYNLGLAWSKAGDNQQAGKAYLEALELRPDDCDILHNLGCAYKAEGLIAEAVTIYEHLLTVDKNYRPGISNLAYLYHLQGEYERAGRLYRQLLELDPEDELAQHMLAALEGWEVTAPPENYVRELFDRYSSHFEQNLLEELEYQVPELLDRLLARRTERKRRFGRVLDLGCGTGLAGEKLKPFATCLDGVDLSAGMLSVAENKGIYDTLVEAEAVAYLESASSRSWDLIVAADVLTYIGDLSPLFTAVANRLPAEGLFCCTTEQDNGEAWSIRPNGRYGHSRDYLVALAEVNGFRIVSAEKVNKRKEGQEWIKGMLWLLQKTG
jgi:predicted TPR repeat methyltransferase